jgi:Na+-translocating ferredoxin:NAD+ oxidoreductase RnfG subunit
VECSSSDWTPELQQPARASRQHVAVDHDGFLCASDGTRVRPHKISPWEVDNDGEHFLRVQGATDTPRCSRVDLDLGPFKDLSEAELLERRLVAAAAAR